MFKLVVLSCLVACSVAQVIPALGYNYVLLSQPNYRGPFSLAPGQPANILGSDGRPLDTLEVNLDKSAHLAAKTLSAYGIHSLKKRSAPLYTAPFSSYAIHSAPLVLPAAPIAPVPYSSPVVYKTPLTYSPYLHY